VAEAGTLNEQVFVFNKNVLFLCFHFNGEDFGCLLKQISPCGSPQRGLLCIALPATAENRPGVFNNNGQRL
jgi:hypothetical protein